MFYFLSCCFKNVASRSTPALSDKHHCFLSKLGRKIFNFGNMCNVNSDLQTLLFVSQILFVLKMSKEQEELKKVAKQQRREWSNQCIQSLKERHFAFLDNKNQDLGYWDLMEHKLDWQQTPGSTLQVHFDNSENTAIGTLKEHIDPAVQVYEIEFNDNKLPLILQHANKHVFQFDEEMQKKFQWDCLLNVHDNRDLLMCKESNFDSEQDEDFSQYAHCTKTYKIVLDLPELAFGVVGVSSPFCATVDEALFQAVHQFLYNLFNEKGDVRRPELSFHKRKLSAY